MSQGITAVDCDGSGEVSTRENGSIPSITGGGETNYWRCRRRRAGEFLSFRGAEGAAPKKSTLAAPKALRRKSRK